jgi:hypothetical protein
MTASPRSQLAGFFYPAGEPSGAFYPTGCLVASFPDLAGAETARRELQKAGVLAEDLIAASGREMVQFAAAHAVSDGLWGMFKSHLSRVIGTEAVYSDADLEAAESGAAFLGVRCPTDPARERAWKVLKVLEPEAARYYGSGGIEHLAGDPQQ